MYELIDELVHDIEKKIINYRREFHKYPETAWMEFRTASLIGKRLMDMGYHVKIGKEVMNDNYRMNVPSNEELEDNYERAIKQGAYEEICKLMTGGFTAVVGILDNGPGPQIALRFDIDGIKVMESKEEDHLPFRNGFSSVNHGIMHACGHDGHIAIGLGVAELIMKFRAGLKGKIKLIFQPAEEGVRGAKCIAESNLLDDVDYIISGHIGMRAKKSGEIVCGTEGFLATSKINAEFKGRSSHAGAAPEKGHNALLSASTAVLNLDAIPRNGQGTTRINVGKLVAGSGRNVVPGRAFMEIETRGETTNLNKYMEEYAERILRASAEMHDTHVEIKHVGKSISAKSDKELVEIIKNVATDMKSYSLIYDKEDFGASEDICYMMKKVQDNGGKAAYIMFGSDLKGEHHSPRFDFNEKDLINAVKLYIEVILRISNKVSYRHIQINNKSVC
ncbi:M20 family metallo-hydrolase [Haloimpatiens massiliensis]|uniref:M20 family metallo-hydrolase n=1 Tax=Haloimpatiens massiliensis TaxID=1658110 RepID=UPI000C86264C|nr:M20 family metallo-hydrolase [Haloimpatiens massiliensis]